MAGMKNENISEVTSEAVTEMTGVKTVKCLVVQGSSQIYPGLGPGTEPETLHCNIFQLTYVLSHFSG